jgi:hypothetical protein
VTATVGCLGLLAVGAGVAALLGGDVAIVKPAATPSWPERYAALRPLVQH